jgi:ADP-heptose:LPS heptosyltransferase
MFFPIIKKPADDVRSILVIHQGALGDFILALPTLGVLRKTFPQAKFTFMGYPRILELVEKRFYADEILSIDQKGMASFFVQGGSLDRQLSHFLSTFDIVTVFGKDEKGTFIGNLRRVCRGQILHIHSFPSWVERIHLADHLLREISRFGFFVSERIPKLHLKESDQHWGRSFWRKKGLAAKEKAEVIILHPGSGSKKKMWPLERFLDLVSCLQKYLDSRILIIIGPAEGAEVQKAFEEMEGNRGGASPILIKGLSLLRLASVMEECRLFIGNDSGISHMAAALGIPTVAVFGPTDPRIWAPRGKRAVVVRTEIPCSPCSQERFFQCQDLECLKRVEVIDVLKGLERLGVGISVLPDGHSIKDGLFTKSMLLGKQGKEESRQDRLKA